MITDTQLDHLAKLAALRVSPDERAALITKFTSIVGLIKKLDKAQLVEEDTVSAKEYIHSHGVSTPSCDTHFRSCAQKNITHGSDEGRVSLGL